MSDLCEGDGGEVSGNRSDNAPSNNRIFLNFTRELTDPEGDCSRIDKVKKLFQLLQENEDLQEAKVFGWFDKDEVREECTEDDEEEEREVNEYWDRGDAEGKGGQRFAMSRDFWYRRLNILKAQKLDEVALEARDLPPRERSRHVAVKIPKLADHRVYSDEVPEKREGVAEEITEFERKVARPAESKLKASFVNVYDNKVHFCQK